LFKKTSDILFETKKNFLRREDLPQGKSEGLSECGGGFPLEKEGIFVGPNQRNEKCKGKGVLR